MVLATHALNKDQSRVMAQKMNAAQVILVFRNLEAAQSAVGMRPFVRSGIWRVQVRFSSSRRQEQRNGEREARSQSR